jgi:small subunit ribosomal protein S7
MSRCHRKTKKRLHSADPIYQSILVHIFVNRLIRHGKKSLSYRILYSVFDQIYKNTKRDPLAIFEYAIYTVTPTVHLKTRRIGGATYQVPMEVSPQHGTALAIQWILTASRNRTGRSIVTQLYIEILDAIHGNGGAVRKCEEVRRIAEANKAFVRYRF